MSSLNVSTIHSFIAPIFIGQHHITTIGSWASLQTPTLQEMLISRKTPFRMILHVWKQQYRENFSDVCLCWVGDDMSKQYIELHTTTFAADIQSIAPYIQGILETKHQEMLTLYQHMHPGAVRSLSTARRVGNEGASQSD
jgi:hypothetical protein